MRRVLAATKIALMLGAIAIMAIGAVATPINAADSSVVAAPCPSSSSATCAYDPDTNIGYRFAVPTNLH